MDPMLLILGFYGVLFLIWLPFYFRGEAKKTKEWNALVAKLDEYKSEEQEYQEWLEGRTGGEIWSSKPYPLQY